MKDAQDVYSLGIYRQAIYAKRYIVPAINPDIIIVSMSLPVPPRTYQDTLPSNVPIATVGRRNRYGELSVVTVCVSATSFLLIALNR